MQSANMRDFVHEILEPCLVPEPTAGAALVISGDTGAAFTLINMSALEAVHIMRFAADAIESHIGAMPEKLQ